MAGRIALVGGDEFRASCRGMDAEILAATGVATPRVVVVPTAAAMERPDLAASNGVQHFNALGADAAPLMVLTADDANDDALIAAADAADVIYLTGGNPAHLLAALAGSRLAAALRTALHRGAIVAGIQRGRDGAGRADAIQGRVERCAGLGARRRGSAASRAERSGARGGGAGGGVAGEHHGAGDRRGYGLRQREGRLARAGRGIGCAVSRGRVGAVCGGGGFWAVARGATRARGAPLLGKGRQILDGYGARRVR